MSTVAFRRAKGDNNGLRTSRRLASTSHHQHDNHYRSAGLYRQRFAEILLHQMPTTAMFEEGRELRGFPASFQVECNDWFSAQHPARARLLADRQLGRGQFLPVQLVVALLPWMLRQRLIDAGLIGRGAAEMLLLHVRPDESDGQRLLLLPEACSHEEREPCGSAEPRAARRKQDLLRCVRLDGGFPQR
jgi:hypothetical protein